MRVVFVVGVCLSICVFLSAGDSYVLDEIKQVKEGDDVEVTCNATASPDVDIYWTSEHHEGIYADGAQLRFTNISRLDAGNYTCHRSNVSNPADNETVESVFMDVLYPAEITMFSVAPDDPRENMWFIMECQVEGNPNPLWEMRKNGTDPVIHRGNYSGSWSIAIMYLTCDKSGLYVCTGANELNHGVNVTREHNVTVLCSPRPRANQSDHYTVYAVPGMDVLMFENVIGYPYPNYTWSRAGGQPMGTMEEYDYPFVSALNISDVKTSDFGQYYLTMANDLGSYRSTYHLIPYGFLTTTSPTQHQGLSNRNIAIIAGSASGVALVVVLVVVISHRMRVKRKAGNTRLVN